MLMKSKRLFYKNLYNLLPTFSNCIKNKDLKQKQVSIRVKNQTKKQHKILKNNIL